MASSARKSATGSRLSGKKKGRTTTDQTRRYELDLDVPEMLPYDSTDDDDDDEQRAVVHNKKRSSTVAVGNTTNNNTTPVGKRNSTAVGGPHEDSFSSSLKRSSSSAAKKSKSEYEGGVMRANFANDNGDGAFFGSDDEDVGAVLPSEAHSKGLKTAVLEKPKQKRKDKNKLDQIDEAYTIEEEAAVAKVASRRTKAGLTSDDFELPGISVNAFFQQEKDSDDDEDNSHKKKGTRKSAAAAVDVSSNFVNRVLLKGGGKNQAAAASSSSLGFDSSTAVVETVAADFAALTNTQRMEMLKRESPEVLKLLDEFKSNIDEVRATLPPLKALLFNTRRADKSAGEAELLDFLEAKVHLMIAYCVHIAFYLYLKVEGQKVEDHPVVDRLVEIRVYLEKMWPVEQRLHYGISKLLSSARQAQHDRTIGGTKKNQNLSDDDEEEDDDDDDINGNGKKKKQGAYSTTTTIGTGVSKLSNLRKVDENTRVRRTVEMDDVRDARRRQREHAEAAAIEQEEMKEMNRIRLKSSASTSAAGSAGKKASQQQQQVTILRPVDEGMQDDEDQFLSRLFHRRDKAEEESKNNNGGIQNKNNNSGEGLSLIQRLRAKLSNEQEFNEAQKRKQTEEKEFLKKEMKKRKVALPGSDEEEEDDDFAGGNAEDGEDVSYENLLSEQKGRDRSKQMQDAALFDALKEEGERELLKKAASHSRRKVSKDITTHRGLTKARPKEKKNPRVNRKMRFEKGAKAAQAQSRQHKAEDSSGFQGVANLKTHITHSTRLN